MNWPGAVVVMRTGEPLRTYGGALTVYADLERAGEVAEDYNTHESLKHLGLFRAVKCRVILEDQGTERKI